MRNIVFVLFLKNRFKNKSENRWFYCARNVRKSRDGEDTQRSKNLYDAVFRFECVLLLFGSLLLVAPISLAAPPKQIIVGPEDTVYGIAYNHGIPTRSLIAANNLKPPYVLKQGQTLIIPSPNEHIVGDHETLQSIADDYGIKADILAQENSIPSPFFVKPGDKLLIPYRDTESLAEALKPPTEEISTAPLAPLPLVKSIPAPSKLNAPIASAEAKTPEPLAPLPDELAEELAREKETGLPQTSSDKGKSKPELMGNLAKGKDKASQESLEPLDLPKAAPITAEKDEGKPEKKAKKEEKVVEKKEEKKNEKATGKADFIWPADGKVISKFSPGGKNDGINIKVSEGTPIKAAADGEVVYAGNELKAFGNLLLLKHKDGWMTAYAHNSTLLVHKGEKVTQGQTIAKSGQTGDVNEPQLHFEVRKGKQPVDPLTKLKS